MQTFLPYSDFAKSAQVLDNKRLGKQRVEVLQLLNVINIGPTTYCDDKQFKKTPWYNHPACNMWKKHPSALAKYGLEICKEWIRRGYKDSCLEKIKPFLTEKEHETPRFIGDQTFHSSHKSALLFKNYNWYSQFGWTEEPKISYYWP